MRMKKPNGGKGYDSKLDMGIGMKEDRDMDRVVIPLGEAGGNIPVPLPRRIRK
jgi:hypothetical protein